MLGIIGGTGFSNSERFTFTGSDAIITPYSDEAVTVSSAAHQGIGFVFISRHGKGHKIAPHRINYRANLWALQKVGVSKIVAVNAVGAIHSKFAPGHLALPDQIIDYSYGREQSFFTEDFNELSHIDFTHPYDEVLRTTLLACAQYSSNDVLTQIMNGGVYACTQGPRLETAAEVRRLKQDGCDMVGMTGMPEAALARELKLAYASIALSVNWAAGLSDELITMQGMTEIIDSGMQSIVSLLQDLIVRLARH